MHRVMAFLCFAVAVAFGGYHYFAHPPQFPLFGFWPSMALIHGLIMWIVGVLLLATDFWGSEEVWNTLVTVFTFPGTYNLLGVLVFVGMWETFLQFLEVAPAAQSMDLVSFMLDQMVVWLILAVVAEVGGGGFGWYLWLNSRRNSTY